MRDKLKVLISFVLVIISMYACNLNVFSAGIQKKAAYIQNMDIDANKDGKAEFKIQLYSDAAGITYKAQKPVLHAYKYMTSATYKYVQLFNGKEIGHVDLNIDSFKGGTDYMFFLDYYSDKSNNPLQYDVVTYCEKPVIDIISFKNIDGKWITDRKAAKNLSTLSNEIMYFESENRYLKFNKIVTTKYLGSSVYEAEANPAKGSFIKSGDIMTLEYRINSVAKKEIRTSWILSTKSMVNWNDDYTVRTAVNMDCIGDTYFFKDGVYRKNMPNYLPRSSKAQTYFKNPSGLQVRACKWVLNKGSLFKVMGLYTMYGFADSFGKDGYIPTQPMSEWLSKDYKIGYNFYDTRFNSDTMSSLMTIYKDYPDEYVLDKMSNYIKFYKNYYKKKQYKVGNAIFVPDYMDVTGKNKINPTALNHFIAEMQVMYEYSELTGDKESLNIAREMLNSIKLTCDKWIRPNGDLWYRVTTDGKYTTNDYPLVTLNDLIYFSQIIKRIEGQVPKEIDKLLQSKTKWAVEQGYLAPKITDTSKK